MQQGELYNHRYDSNGIYFICIQLVPLPLPKVWIVIFSLISNLLTYLLPTELSRAISKGKTNIVVARQTSNVVMDVDVHGEFYGNWAI